MQILVQMVKVPMLVLHKYIYGRRLFPLFFPYRSHDAIRKSFRSRHLASPRFPCVVVLVSRRMQIDAPGSARKPAIYPLNPGSFSELPPRRRDKSRASRRYCAYLSGPHLERKAYPPSSACPRRIGERGGRE